MRRWVRVATSLLVMCLSAAVAAADEPMIFLKDDSVLLDASATQGHPSGFEWYVRPPGATEPDQPTATGPQYELGLSALGFWTVRLVALYDHEAVDGGGNYTAEFPQEFQVLSVIASLSTPAVPVEPTQEVLLDGTQSRIAQGVTPTTSWEIEGPSAYLECPTDQLTCTIPAGALDPGTYTATLTLIGDGDESSDSDVFQVVDNSLAVAFSWTVSPRDFTVLTFSATLYPPSASVANAVWNFGDGSGDQNCPSSDCMTAVNHNFAEAGTYDVTVTVTATDGRQTSTTQPVEVTEAPPVPTASFSATPNSLSVMQSVLFQFTGSCQGTCSYTWGFGDGTGSTAQLPSHTYVRSGTFNSTLTVTNESGQDSTNQTIEVSNCWDPAPPAVGGTLDPSRVCWGDRIEAVAASGEAFLWSTGATTASALVSNTGSYWLSADQGSSCWGTVGFVVEPSNCGDSNGDADLDGSVDAADAAALIVELTDGDGTAVNLTGGGDTAAPGGDVNLDGAIMPDDLELVLQALFSDPT